MALRVKCTCGKVVRVQNELAGKFIKCVGCGEPVEVPVPSLEDTEDRLDHPRPGRKRHPERADRRSSSLVPWLVCGAAVLALGTVGLVLLLNNKDTKPAGDKPDQARAEAPGVQGNPLTSPAEPKPQPVAQNPAQEQPRPVAEGPAKDNARPPEVAKPVVPNEVRRPLSETEQRQRDVLDVRVAQFGKAEARSWKELAGRPLAGVVVELEARAAATVHFTAPAVTAFTAAGKEVPAVLLFIADGKDAIKTARSFKGTTAQNGDVTVGSDKFHFELPGLNAVQNQWLLLPVSLEGKPGIEYGFAAGGRLKLGFLFAESADALTHVRLLGHAFALNAARDPVPLQGGDVARRPEPMKEPLRPPVKEPVKEPAREPFKEPEPKPQVVKGPAKPEVYHFDAPEKMPGHRSLNISIMQQDKLGKQVVKMLTKGSQVSGKRQPDGTVRLIPDLPGSTGIHVLVNPKVGYTTVAGLRFKKNAIIDIWDDGVVQVHQANIPASDEEGNKYVSRRMTVNERKAIVMVRLPRHRPAVAARPEEATPAEKNEKLAAAKLTLAESLLQAGKTDKARTRLEEIIAKYPQTETAKEARALLEKIKKK